jgi:predicted GNAT family acetyltransferase
VDTTTTVTDEPQAHRYVIVADGDVAGYTQYRTRPGLVAFVHTEIDQRMEGRGLGGTLISAALADARAKGLAVLPYCPFVNAYIKRHPEYRHLVPRDEWEAFGLDA